MQRFQLSPSVQKKLRELDLNLDDVIRKALDIKAEGFDCGKDVFLPEGTRFLAWNKERPYWGVIKDGAILLQSMGHVSEGSGHMTLSGAASASTGKRTENGWQFWMVALPNKSNFVPIASLRKDGKYD